MYLPENFTSQIYRLLFFMVEFFIDQIYQYKLFMGKIKNRAD